MWGVGVWGCGSVEYGSVEYGSVEVLKCGGVGECGSESLVCVSFRCVGL